MDLRFYDFEFNHIHTQIKSISVVWNLKYRGYGNFEAHFSINSGLGNLIKDYRFLIVCQGDKQAVITSREIIDNEIILYGKEPSYLLSKRVIPKFASRNGRLGTTNGEIAENIIKSAFSDVENFYIENISVMDYAMTDFWRNTAHPLSEIVSDLALKSNVGYKITFDIENKRWVLRFYKGKELELIVSEGNKTAYDVSYSDTLEDYATDVYYLRSYEYMGSWNAAENSPELFDNLPENYGKKYYISSGGSAFGKNFTRGYYLVCNSEDGAFGQAEDGTGFWCLLSSGKGKGIYRWEKTVDGTTDKEAEEDLFKSDFDIDLSLKTRKLYYGKDYNLGDCFIVKYENNGLLFSKKVMVYSVRFFEDFEESGERPYFREAE